ncbi:hypothetical protein CIHG_01990 [Coccidioides immitis H538.4]|uniref:Uncharacterized protein n=3 Tax=Coccidioides immitis TaxID=5501 RepID=A0A0J8QR27_COCIT|nr:hypothetical protein CIRG_06307 [Coccidioides immitis RMSCC 2394]KMU73688.1 hypothetical protein CISG_03738 [Coccidioides immitis RMSCC 3703]KMU84204.1 hypothetical protein CIHG_01990 [Coccidioides immitis H538.4]
MRTSRDFTPTALAVFKVLGCGNLGPAKEGCVRVSADAFPGRRIEPRQPARIAAPKITTPSAGLAAARGHHTSSELPRCLVFGFTRFGYPIAWLPDSVSLTTTTTKTKIVCVAKAGR